MKVTRLGTICARGGSKGVKNKNIRDFCGKPLIAHIIDIAKKAPFDYLAVSSDSDEILEIAKESGVAFLIKRPIEMATDTAAKLPAIQHCAKEAQKMSGMDFSTFVDLSVTSPLMLPEDILGAIRMAEENEVLNVITGAISSNSPYFSMVEKTENQFVTLAKIPPIAFERRQDCPATYDMNGAIYVWKKETFFNLSKIITEKTMIYEMPHARSVDIDTELDFEFAMFLYQKRIQSKITNVDYEIKES